MLQRLPQYQLGWRGRGEPPENPEDLDWQSQRWPTREAEVEPPAKTPTPEDEAALSEARGLTIAWLKKRLTPREFRVITLRFGLDGNEYHTLEELGRQFSVTRERVRQIEARALRKLRHPSCRKIACGLALSVGFEWRRPSYFQPAPDEPAQAMPAGWPQKRVGSSAEQICLDIAARIFGGRQCFLEERGTTTWLVVRRQPGWASRRWIRLYGPLPDGRWFSVARHDDGHDCLRRLFEAWRQGEPWELRVRGDELEVGPVPEEAHGEGVALY